jgi:hypothetical protein
LKKKPPSPSIHEEKSPPFFKKNWMVYACLFIAFSSWAMYKYDSEFFPFRLDYLLKILSPEGLEFPPLGLLAWYAKGILISGLFLVEAAWCGWTILRNLVLLEAAPLEKAVLAEALGIALFSLLSTALGFSHLLYPTVLWGTYGALGVGVLASSILQPAWRQLWTGAARELRRDWQAAGLGLFKVLVCFLLAFNLLMDFTPEIFYDSLFYHLALPHLYLLEHRIVNLPYMNFSKFPQGGEMLFAWGLALQGEIFTKLLNGVMAPLTFLALLMVSKRMGNVRIWPIASALLLTIPVVSIALWNSSVDLPLVFYSLVALYAAWMWLDSAPASRRGWVLLAGVFAGMAASTKYMGGSVIMALVATAAWYGYWEGKLRTPLAAEVIVCGVICLAWVGPWFVRNWLDTGNPFYPLFYHMLDGKYLWPEHLAGLMGEVRGYVPRDLWGWIRIPWALTVGEPKGAENTCWLGPTFWVALPAFLFIPTRQKWLSILLPYTLVNFLAEAFSTNQARYLLQGYAALALLAAAGLVYFYDQGVRGLRGLVLLPILAAAGSNVYGALLTAHGDYDPAPVLTGRVSRLQYVSMYHPGMNPNPIDPLYEFMRHLPREREGRVLFVGEEKTYRCPWPYVYSNVRDRMPLIEWNREYPDPASLYQALLRSGIRYFIYNDSEGFRLRVYDIFYWEEEEKARFAEFWEQYVRPVYAKDGLDLFEILPLEEAQRQPAVPCPFLRWTLS